MTKFRRQRLPVIYSGAWGNRSSDTSDTNNNGTSSSRDSEIEDEYNEISDNDASRSDVSDINDNTANNDAGSDMSTFDEPIQHNGVSSPNSKKGQANLDNFAKPAAKEPENLVGFIPETLLLNFDTDSEEEVETCNKVCDIVCKTIKSLSPRSVWRTPLSVRWRLQPDDSAMQPDDFERNHAFKRLHDALLEEGFDEDNIEGPADGRLSTEKSYSKGSKRQRMVKAWLNDLEQRN